MKISIVLICYNQAGYISQCLESIAMQNSNFETEIIVADDSSTDNTLSVIQKFANAQDCPYIFLKDEGNLGISKNYKRAFAACTGNYIAVIEGDDYWTDPNRLIKHVTFLEEHRECVMSMNRTIVFNMDQNLFSISDWEHSENYKFINSQQMALGNKLGNLSACVFRKSEIDKIKPDLFELNIADWMIGLVLSQYGFIAILKDAMSVYRVHSNGRWSRMSETEQHQNMLETIDIYNKYLEFNYNNEFTILKNYLNNSDKRNSMRYAMKDFIPPIIVYVFKLLIPNVIIQSIKKFLLKILR